MIVAATNLDDLNHNFTDIQELFRCSTSSFVHYYHAPKTLLELLKNADNFLVLLFYEAGRLVAVLPLIEHQNFMIKFSIVYQSKMRLPFWKIVGDHPLVADDSLVNSISALFEYMRTTYPGMGIVVDFFRHSSPLFESINQSRANYIPCYSKDTFTYSLSLPKTLNEFTRGFSKKRRYNFNRSVRLLAEAEQNGELTLIEYSSPDDMEKFFDDSERVRSKSWQGRLLGNNARNIGFIRTQESLVNSGIFRSFVLRKSENAIAFLRGYQTNGKYFYEEIGFDPNWSSYSPGTVLNWMFFEKIFDNDRPQHIEFGLGDAQYKRIFGSSQESASSGVLTFAVNRIFIWAKMQLWILNTEVLVRNMMKAVNMDSVIRSLIKKAGDKK